MPRWYASKLRNYWVARHDNTGEKAIFIDLYNF